MMPFVAVCERCDCDLEIRDDGTANCQDQLEVIRTQVTGAHPLHRLIPYPHHHSAVDIQDVASQYPLFHVQQRDQSAFCGDRVSSNIAIEKLFSWTYCYYDRCWMGGYGGGERAEQMVRASLKVRLSMIVALR